MLYCNFFSTKYNNSIFGKLEIRLFRVSLHCIKKGDLFCFRLMKSEVGSRNGSEEFDTLIGPVTNDFDDFFVSIIAMKVPTHFYVSILNHFS